MPTNPMNQLLIVFLTTPQSSFYLPKLLQNSHDPDLEPFQGKVISLGQHTVEGIKADLSISNVLIRGLSNIQIEKQNNTPRITIDGDQVTFYAIRPNTEAPPSGIPAKLEVSGDLNYTPIAQPGMPPMPEMPPIPFTADISDTQIIGVFNATSNDGQAEEAVIDFTGLSIIAAPTAENISINIEIQSFFKEIINNAVRAPNVLKNLVAGINSHIGEPQALRAISKSATTAARTALNSSPL